MSRNIRVAERIKIIAIFFGFCFNITSKGKSNFLLSFRETAMREKSKRVCMFVLNHCTNDARVLKEAETLGRAGYNVDIVAIASEVAPDYMEEKEYFRIFRVQPRTALFYLKRFEQFVKALTKRQTTPSRTGRADKVSFKKNLLSFPAKIFKKII